MQRSFCYYTDLFRDYRDGKYCQRVIAVSKDIEFNSDILDLKDRGNIDLSSFSRAGYITPGKYELIININNNELSGTYRVDYIVPKDDPKASEPCISPILVKQFALRPEWLKS